MNTLLLVSILLLVISSVVRIIFIIINPMRVINSTTGTGIVSSLSILLPVFIMLINRNFFFFEASFGAKLTALVLFLVFFIIISLSTYAEYTDRKYYLKSRN